MEQEINKIAVTPLNKFNCQSYPLIEDKIIYCTQEELDAIGTTKCFDLYTLSVVDYDNTHDLEIEQYKEEYALKMQYLNETDYISNKLAEANSKYIATNDNTDVIILRDKYKIELQTREQYRQRISELKDILDVYNKKNK